MKKRAAYNGRAAGWQATRHEEMQAVAEALSLLANIVMACNTARMPEALDHWAQRSGGAVSPKLDGRVTRTGNEGSNLRSVFRFPVERYAEKVLASSVVADMTASTA